MFWRKKPMQYEICVPPIRNSFEEMDHQETESYFQWHLSVMNERIDYLTSQVCAKLAIPRNRMDLSAESLLPLWKWFLSVIEIEETPTEALQWFWEHDNHPEPFRAELLKQRQKQYTLETEMIFQDLGKYLGAVFVHTVPGISWTYYERPKSDVWVNMPVLQGFADFQFDPPFIMFFEPVHMAHVQAAKIWDNTQKTEDLLNLYLMWKQKSIETHGQTFQSVLDKQTKQRLAYGSIRSLRNTNTICKYNTEASPSIRKT